MLRFEIKEKFLKKHTRTSNCFQLLRQSVVTKELQDLLVSPLSCLLHIKFRRKTRDISTFLLTGIKYMQNYIQHKKPS